MTWQTKFYSYIKLKQAKNSWPIMRKSEQKILVKTGKFQFPKSSVFRNKKNYALIQYSIIISSFFKKYSYYASIWGVQNTVNLCKTMTTKAKIGNFVEFETKIERKIHKFIKSIQKQLASGNSKSWLKMNQVWPKFCRNTKPSGNIPLFLRMSDKAKKNTTKANLHNQF